MMKLINWIYISFLHAKYHRNLKKAIVDRENKDLLLFKKHIYQAEDAWKKIVIIKNKQKQKEE